VLNDIFLLDWLKIEGHGSIRSVIVKDNKIFKQKHLKIEQYGEAII
jgi:hypothetical protein